VTVVVPKVAVAVAVNETVMVHVGLHGLFVKLAVTPVGRVEVEKVIDPVPLTIVAVIEDEGLDAPCMTVRLLGDGVDNEKSNAGTLTVKESVAEWVAPPPVPVIVTVTVPVVAVGVAENETVIVHVGLHGLFVNVAVTPVGSADVEKVTEPLPLTSVAVIEDEGLVAP
jgi:hypothetical protein